MKQIILLITMGIVLVLTTQAIIYVFNLTSAHDKYLYTAVGYIFGIYVEKFRKPILSAVLSKQQKISGGKI